MLDLTIEATDDAAGCGEEHVSRAASIAYIVNQKNKNRNQGINCVVCRDEIPELRRQYVPGCLHCITCQTEMDKNGNHLGEPMEYVFVGYKEPKSEDDEPQTEEVKTKNIVFQNDDVTTAEAFDELLQRIDSDSE
jgi:hypothetical protein